MVVLGEWSDLPGRGLLVEGAGPTLGPGERFDILFSALRPRGDRIVRQARYFLVSASPSSGGAFFYPLTFYPRA